MPRGVNLQQVPQSSQSLLNDSGFWVKMSWQASRQSRSNSTCCPRPWRQCKLFPVVRTFGRGLHRQRNWENSVCVCKKYTRGCDRTLQLPSTSPCGKPCSARMLTCSWGLAGNSRYASWAKISCQRATTENGTVWGPVGMFRPSQEGTEVSFSFKCPILRMTGEEDPHCCMGGRRHGTQQGCCEVSAWEGVKLLPFFPSSESVLVAGVNLEKQWLW